MKSAIDGQVFLRQPEQLRVGLVQARGQAADCGMGEQDRVQLGFRIAAVAAVHGNPKEPVDSLGWQGHGHAVEDAHCARHAHPVGDPEGREAAVHAQVGAGAAAGAVLELQVRIAGADLVEDGVDRLDVAPQRILLAAVAFVEAAFPGVEVVVEPEHVELIAVDEPEDGAFHIVTHRPASPGRGRVRPAGRTG